MRDWLHKSLWRYFTIQFSVITFIVLIITFFVLFYLDLNEWLRWIEEFPILRWLVPFILSFIIGVTTASIVSRTILKPITTLKNSMNQVIQSDFAIQIDEDHPIQEVVELNHAFNVMVQELNSIERFQQDFIATISHEFKTPLSNIQGYAQLLQSPQLSEQQRDNYQQKIITATKQLNKLSNNVLHLTKLENQSLLNDQTHFRLDESIRQAIVDLHSLWEDKNIQLDLQLEPLYIWGNADLLYQVWLNLVENAIRYNVEGGSLSIHCAEHANDVQVTIKDSGIGMDKDTLKHATERFYKADRSRQSIGHGLGLSIVARIITIHQGTLTFESEPHQGTTVTLTFPKSKPNHV